MNEYTCGMNDSIGGIFRYASNTARFECINDRMQAVQSRKSKFGPREVAQKLQVLAAPRKDQSRSPP